MVAGRSRKPSSNRMEVHVTPETAKKLNDLAATRGRAPEQIVEDVLAGYFQEAASLRKTLDSRYDDLKTGRRLRDSTDDRDRTTPCLPGNP